VLGLGHMATARKFQPVEYHGCYGEQLAVIADHGLRPGVHLMLGTLGLPNEFNDEIYPGNVIVAMAVAPALIPNE
jgi:hypothetical protein